MQWAPFLSASLEFQDWNKSKDLSVKLAPVRDAGPYLNKVPDSALPALVLS